MTGHFFPDIEPLKMELTFFFSEMSGTAYPAAESGI
jgi:hypothetical protein